MTEAISDEAFPPALNLFQVPPKVCGIQNVQWIDYRPVSQVSFSSPLEFNISGAGSEYTDLSRTYLHIRARITKNGLPITDTEDVSPVNLWLHSLFTQCDITIQQKLLYNSGRFYAYKSYIDTILNYTRDKANMLEAEMFYKDSAGGMDSTTVKILNDPNLNTGLFLRYNRVKRGWVDMIGKLHADLCHIDKLMLNGVDIGVKLYPSRTAFCLMAPADDPAYNIEFDSVVLKVCKVQIDPEVYTAQSAVLAKGITAKYPINKSEISSFVIPKGATFWAQSDLFQNRVPTQLIIALVASKAAQGDFKRNPYNFNGFGLNTLTVTKNGQVVPFKSLRLNFKTGEVSEAYKTLYKSDAENHGISLQDFQNGYALYVYRLDDQAYDYACLPQTQAGNLSIEGQFDSALPENVSVIVYAKFSGIVEVDQYRGVST
jgi:hypothetical protein